MFLDKGWDQRFIVTFGTSVSPNDIYRLEFYDGLDIFWMTDHFKQGKAIVDV
jgi:hypothetical protein